jgi:hypothetical protein
LGQFKSTGPGGSRRGESKGPPVHLEF